MGISLLTWRNLVCYYFSPQQNRMRSLLRAIPLKEFLKFIDIPKSIKELRTKNGGPVNFETVSEFMDFQQHKDNTSVISAANSLNFSLLRSDHRNSTSNPQDDEEVINIRRMDTLVVVDQIFVEIHKRLNILLSVLLLQTKPDGSFSFEEELNKVSVPKKFFLFRKLIIKKIMTLIIKFMSFRGYLPGQKNSIFRKGIRKIKFEYSQLNIDDKLNMLYSKKTIGEWLDSRVLIVLEEIVSTNITFHNIIEEGNHFDEKKMRIRRTLYRDFMKGLIVKDDSYQSKDLAGRKGGVSGVANQGGDTEQLNVGSIGGNGFEGVGLDRRSNFSAVIGDGASRNNDARSEGSVFDVGELSHLDSSSIFNLDFNSIRGLI